MNSEQKIIDLLIKQSEGVKLTASEDSDGLLNIGINLVKYYPHGALIREHDTCTEKQALDWTHKKLHKDVYPAVYDFCRRHHVPIEVYESLCVFAYNEGTEFIKTNPFIVCLVNSRWSDLSKLIAGYHLIDGVFSKEKVGKRMIEMGNFMPVYVKDLQE